MNEETKDELTTLRARVDELEAENERLKSEGGPINSERMILDELLAVLAKWKAVASGRTCVSFENLCYGASSLWHQTHRDNFRKIDRKPAELSRWVLKHAGHVLDDFPAQVLGILVSLESQFSAAKEREGKLRGAVERTKEILDSWGPERWGHTLELLHARCAAALKEQDDARH